MASSRENSKSVLLRELDSLRQMVEDGQVLSLFDQMPLPYHSLDSDGKILSVNASWLDLLGYEKEDVLGTWFGDYLTSESVELFEGRFCTFKVVGEVCGVEFTMIRRDGARILVSINGRISYDGLGKFQRSHCIVHDITAKRRFDKALASSEQRFRGLFESSIDGIIYVDLAGTIINVNPAFCRILGSSRDILLGKNARDIVSFRPFYGTWQKFITSMIKAVGTDEEVRLDLLHAKGYPVSVSIRFWSDSDNALRPNGIWVMVKDISKTLQAEEALKKSEAQHRRIVETANEGIIGLDASLYIVFSNQVLADFLGYEQNELLGQPANMIFPSDDGARLDHKLAMRGEDAKERYECPFKRKDGSVVWGLVSISKLLSESGEQTGSFAMIADITEHKIAEEALRRSENLLHQVEHVSLSGGWEVNLSSGEVFWTEGQYRLYGLEPGSPPPSAKEYIQKYVHPDDRSRLWKAWMDSIKSGTTSDLDHRVVVDGRPEAIYHTKGVTGADENGRINRIYGSTRDVSLERQAAFDLEKSHGRLLSILDGIDADIYVSDLDETNILFMNAHMQESFDVPEGEVKCHEVFRKEDEPCVHCPKSHLLDENGNPVDTMITERFNPKTERWYLNHDRAIEWLEGNLVHMHMAADITELKEMEEELKHAMAEAEAANVAKNEFLANMSHEIRTPLNGLLGMLQILQLTKLVDEQHDYLNTALDSGRSLLQILNDILDLSKIESGMMDFEEEDTELGEILDSVVSVFRHVVKERGVSMSWKIDESLQRHFKADIGRLRQILFNLVGNAAKFTETGSVVVEAYPLPILAADGKTRVYFSITDTGIGIPENKIDQMFDPFTQVDGSSSRKYQGTGLGLGIVHRLVSLMNGSITVDSKEGEGTAIAFTVALEPGAATTATAVVGTREGIRALQILVAEDEQVNRIVVERLLKSLGHEATCVADGETAVGILRSGRHFDCLLTDIQMPGMDGIETTRVIRENLGLDIPVIALTAHAMKGDQKRFLDAGMNGYIAKPFEMAELQQEIQRVVAEFLN